MDCEKLPLMRTKFRPGKWQRMDCEKLPLMRTKFRPGKWQRMDGEKRPVRAGGASAPRACSTKENRDGESCERRDLQVVKLDSLHVKIFAGGPR